MKPTTDIVEELRLYNRWRRGDEAITAPDPTALGKLLDDAADRIEHLFASGIHTCNADCQRPMCVLRRERDKAQNDLARVTAELEHHKSVKETIDSAHKELSREHAALRARFAELEKELEHAQQCVKFHSENSVARHARAEQAEQRNAELEQYRAGDAVALAQLRLRVEHADSEVTAQTKQRIDAENRVAELVAALRDAVGMLEELDGLDWGEEGMPFDVDFNHFAKVLARAESATPLPMREDPRYRGTDFRSAIDVDRASQGGGK